MKDGSNDLDRLNRPEAEDPLWRLLGKNPLPEPDGWFTARTLARCRHAQPDPGFLSYRGFSRWALAGGLGVALAAMLVVPQFQSRTAAREPQKDVQDAFAIVASLNASESDAPSTLTSGQDSSL